MLINPSTIHNHQTTPSLWGRHIHTLIDSGLRASASAMGIAISSRLLLNDNPTIQALALTSFCASTLEAACLILEGVNYFVGPQVKTGEGMGPITWLSNSLGIAAGVLLAIKQSEDKTLGTVASSLAGSNLLYSVTSYGICKLHIFKNDNQNPPNP